MSLESKIDELIAALERNTAAIAANLNPGALATKPAAATKPAKPAKETAPAAPAAQAPATPAKDLDAPKAVDMQALGVVLTELAELVIDGKDVGRQKAVAILGEFGAKTMSAVPAARLPEFEGKVKAALTAFKSTPATPSLL
jgi:hypothetical protein